MNRKFIRTALLATTVSLASISGALAVDTGTYGYGSNALTRVLVSGLATFSTGPFGNGLPEGDLVEKVRSGRHGIHAMIRYADDPDGEHLIPIGSRRNMRTDLEDIPEIFLSAILATEDKRFFEHAGVDPLSTLRATSEYMTGRIRGASGITQQLVKNQVTGSDVTFGRKITEAVLSVRVEAALPKREILQSYLGAVWFGRAWGAASAPETWFGKTWDEITLAETAFLAGLLQGPGLLNPLRNPERAHARKNIVLDAMLANEMISPQDHEIARAEEITVIRELPSIASSTWETLSVERSIRTMGVTDIVRPRPTEQGVPVITSSIERKWQETAQETLNTHLGRHARLQSVGRVDGDFIEKVQDALSGSGSLSQNDQGVIDNILSSRTRNPVIILSRNNANIEGLVLEREDDRRVWSRRTIEAPWGARAVSGLSRGDVIALDAGTGAIAPLFDIQGSVVVMENATGQVLASIGGSDVGLSAFDRTLAQRQPGSSMKAFVWLAALEYGMRPSDLVSDRPRTFAGGYRPRNYGGSVRGTMPLYTAFEVSSNVVSVSLANEMGIGVVSETALLAGGYSQPLDPYLPSALGATTTTLGDLAQGFATIANGGHLVTRSSVTDVEDNLGVHWDLRETRGEYVFSDQSIEDMMRMLRGVITRGTASQAFSGHPVSLIGKTGTSQDYRDALFIGSTADITVAVWLGRDDNQPMGRVLGGSHAAPVAADILRKMYDDGVIDRNGRRDGTLISMDWPPEPFGQSRNQGRVINSSSNQVRGQGGSGGVITNRPNRIAQELDRRPTPSGGLPDYFQQSSPSGPARVTTQPLSSPPQRHMQPSRPSTPSGGGTGYFNNINRNSGILR